MNIKSQEEKHDIGFVHSKYGHYFDKPKAFADLLLISMIFVVIALLFLSSISVVEEIAKGEGKVIPSNKIQKIQSLDGGIVSDILVKTGQHISKDEPLMKIDTTRFQASVEEIEEERIHLLAKKIRLNGQIAYDYKEKKIPHLQFSKEIEKRADIVTMEKDIFKNNLDELNSALKVLELQYKQKKEERKEISAKIKQLKKTLTLSKKELKTIAKMVRSGSKSKVEFLNTKKEYNEFKGELEGAELSLPRAQLAISEAKSKIEERIQVFKSEFYQEIQEINIQLNKIESKLISASDKLEKTIVKSPVDGIIKQINLNTIGGVVNSGEDLIEIVPDSDILLVEAKIDPKDIAFISYTQKAIVKLTAYDYTVYGSLKGEIIEISADSIKDKESKEEKSYYQVIIKTSKNYLEKNNQKLPIIPGMITTVDIIIGEKTVMDFFLKPIIKVKENLYTIP